MNESELINNLSLKKRLKTSLKDKEIYIFFSQNNSEYWARNVIGLDWTRGTYYFQYAVNYYNKQK